ncbi:unnamed protein product [Calicophoron daubneyi]|uniref:Transient receptor ion channel domain-containing protein n=1 Tax=Calicophoron daubneyi TaxID=300641 RepID=A0AAV2TAM5_CALDB
MRRTSVKEAEGNCSVQRRESLATDQPGKGQGEEDKANQKSRQRRFTLQNLAQYRKYGRRTYSNIEYAALTKLNMDPLCALLGMEYEKAGFGTDSIDSSTTSRNRRGKKYGRYTPSVVETNGYTTALGPLLEKRTLHPLERVFLEAAENGDKSTVARCLSFRDKVNVNCVNMLGRTAIQIAVDNENIEIVELLLKQPGIKIGDALLYAIQEGVYRIVEMLINHPSITKEMLGTAWNDNEDLESPEEESHDFSADISPVILAAICNQFEILQLLLNRGARIEEPHKSSCTCAVCLKYLATDPLKHTLQRINTYRALASPAWISLTSPDPILTAFKLSAEMLHLASEENEFKDTFNSLCEQCRKYACDLLDLCRGTNEVVSVLGKSDDSDEDESDSDESEDDPLTRCDQHKDYTVSSSTCQVHEAENTADCFNSTTVGTNNDWRALAAWYDGTKKHHKHKPGHTVHLITDSIMESQHTTAKDPEMDGIPIPTEDQSHVICPNEIDGNRKLFSGLSRTSNLRPDAMCVSQDQTSKCKDDFEPDEFEGAEFSAGTEAESNLFCGSRTDSFGRELDDLTVGRKYFKRYGGNCYKCRRKENGNSEVSGEDSHKGKSKDEASPIFKLDRLKLAIEYEQKKFVAHPHCQHLLTTLWYDQLPGWRKRNGVTRVLLCFAFILTLPVLSIMYLLYPRGKVGRFLRIPLVKFINHSASFAIFIILLLIASMHTENEEYVKARGEVRGPQPNAIELLVLWFVTGFIWGEMKQVWEEGLAGYTRQWWNWLDFIMLCLYTSTVALRVMAFILRKTQQYGNDAAPRPEWPASDPTLFSEALFSIAHIFSFSRIIFLFQCELNVLSTVAVGLWRLLLFSSVFFNATRLYYPEIIYKAIYPNQIRHTASEGYSYYCLP